MSLPSLSALDMLDTLARTQSVGATARQMNLSQSAISHRLRTLEQQLGFRLTIPDGRGIALTGDAERYVAAIRPALAALRAAQDLPGTARGRLDIAVPSGLAATWLAPRLPEFLRRHPDMSATVHSIAAGNRAPPCDVTITFADAPPDGAEHLVSPRFFPVCSPSFLTEGLPRCPLPGQLLHLHRRDDWEQWLANSGAPQRLGGTGHCFDGILAMYAAAEAGLGLCLGDTFTCQSALQQGRLVRPYSGEMTARSSYWLVTPRGGFSTPAALFADWLRGCFAGALATAKPPAS